MKRELNQGFLNSLSPPSEGRLEVSDTKRPGLHFRLSSTGQAVWMYEKRIKGGTKRRHTLGKHSRKFGLSEARALALELEVEAAQGIDRVAINRATKEAEQEALSRALSVRQVLDMYGNLHLTNLRTGRERKLQIQKALADKLDTPINELRRSDLQAAIDAKASEDHKVAANRIP